MVKFDNRLLKYSVIIVIIYFLVSKVTSDQLPGGNPFLLTGIISVVIYILDQPNILFENFEANNKNNIMHNNSVEQQDIQKNILKSIVREVFDEHNKKKEFINEVPIQPTTTITITDQNQIKEHFELAPIINKEQDANKISDIKENKQDSSITDMLTSGLPTTTKIITDVINATKAEKCDCEETANKAIVNFLQNRRLLDNNGMLHYADAYIGDMGYSQIKLDKYIPLGANGDGVYDSWNLAQYNIINTDRWKPPTEAVPRCKSDSAAPEVQPMDSRAPLNLMNFDYSRKIMPPSNISTKYISERLNA